MKQAIFPIILLLFTAINPVSAQDWFSEIRHEEQIEGYVIGIAGDTITGNIKYDYPIIMQNRVIFTEANNSGKEVQYTPFDVWGYSFNGTYYESILIKMETYQGIYSFNRFGILSSEPGAMGIYRIYPERDKLKKNVSSLEAEIEYEKIPLYPSKNDLSLLYVKKLEEPAVCMGTKSFQKKFIENISRLISDHEQLLQKVTSNEYTIENIQQIVNEYNRFYRSRQFQK